MIKNQGNFSICGNAGANYLPTTGRSR